MRTIVLRAGQLIGLLGILLMAAAAVQRVSGSFTLGDYAVGTLLLASIGVVAVGCFLLLIVVAGDVGAGHSHPPEPK